MSSLLFEYIIIFECTIGRLWCGIVIPSRHWPFCDYLIAVCSFVRSTWRVRVDENNCSLWKFLRIACPCTPLIVTSAQPPDISVVIFPGLWFSTFLWHQRFIEEMIRLLNQSVNPASDVTHKTTHISLVSPYWNFLNHSSSSVPLCFHFFPWPHVFHSQWLYDYILNRYSPEITSKQIE